jgi:hypothetical protein
MASQYSICNFHFLDEHLAEIDADEIIIIENLGAQHNYQVTSSDTSNIAEMDLPLMCSCRQCFFSEYGENKVPVILYEKERDDETSE